MAQEANDSAPGSGGASVWLHGRTVDWLFGYGLAYLLVTAGLFALPWLGAPSHVPAAVAYLMAIGISGPHYGATLLRILGHPEDRERYRGVMWLATGGMLLWLLLSLRHAWLGSLLISAYVYWSPWHFGAQNYGLALMSLRRRGIALDPLAKRALQASFALSVVLAALATNTATIGTLGAVARTEEPYQVVRVLLVPGLAHALGLGLAVAWLACVAVFFVRQRSEASAADLAPSLGLVGCQVLWFGVPALLEMTGRVDLMGLAFATAWISAAHAIQYLWVTTYGARRAPGPGGLARFLGKAAAAGGLYLFLPGFLIASTLARGLPWEAGLSIVVVAAGNVHHFILDGAIWKLRDRHVARLLLTPGAPPLPAPTVAERSRLGIPVIAIGAACLAAFGFWIGEQRAVSDPHAPVARLELAAQRLEGLGRASPSLHLRIGRAHVERGDLEAARRAFERSLELAPRAEAWGALAALHENARRFEDAGEAWAAARRLDPLAGEYLYREHRLAALRAGTPDPDAAAFRAVAAERVGPGEAPASARAIAASRAFAGLLRVQGRDEEAVAVLQQAIARAPSRLRSALVIDLAEALGAGRSEAPEKTITW